MPNDVTMLVHHLRCVGGTQGEPARENGVWSIFEALLRSDPKVAAEASCDAYVDSSEFGGLYTHHAQLKQAT